MGIYVTKPFLPPVEEYEQYVREIYERDILTNQGPCVQKLERKLADFLQATHFHYVTNGTIALQLALKALDITEGEIITTPFSYVATVSSILWERCTPVFVDIEPDNFTIDVEKIERAITPRTKAVLGVHVFGYACDVEGIQEIANKHGLRVIYDGAHAFASRYKGRSLLGYGDVSTCSFHATKLFHTIEGGACITENAETAARLDLLRRFGNIGDEYPLPGINGKQTEFNAAMGLANFDHLAEILAARKHISELYDSLLSGNIRRPKKQEGLEYNYAYYPAVFADEEKLLAAFKRLGDRDIFPRRYFYPSLNRLPYLAATDSCPVSEDISRRIACLPLYPGLKDEEVRTICEVLS